MKHLLSFAQIIELDSSIIEVIVNKDIEITIEMMEEYDEFLDRHFTQAIGVLVNTINPYRYSFEAKLLAGSHEKVKVMAVLYYKESTVKQVQEITQTRAVDNLNVKTFNALNMGRQTAKQWLESQLALVSS